MSQFALGSAFSGQTAEQAVREGKKASNIPAGDYLVALTGVEIKRKQRKGAADGVLNTLFKLAFTVQEGEHTGRIIWRHIGVDHESADYMRSSTAFVGSLAIACGNNGPVTSLDPFMHRPVVAKVIVGKDRGDEYGPQNDIRDFRAHNGMPVGAPAPSAPSYAPQPSVAATPATASHQSAPVAANAMAPSAMGGATPPWRS